MSALTCEFCGRISTKLEGWRQIFTRSMTEHDDEVTYMICPKCHKKIIEDNVGAVVDPDLEMDAIMESLDDSNPGAAYVGLKLRDFLCSDMYLKTQGIYFRDKYDIDITDYMPLMDSVIIAVNEPDENNRIKVTLNCDTSEYN